MPTVTDMQLINSGLGGPGFHVLGDELSQVWRAFYSDGSTGDIHISPIESIYHKDITVKLRTLAGSLKNTEFPFWTNNLAAEVQYRQRLYRLS